ncbi:MAG: EamA family transporter [Adhaeribacter sp.]
MAAPAAPLTPVSPPRWQIYLAFAAVYLIWGSTYLGMKFAIETIPPLFMSAIRFVIAGAFLLAYCRWVKKMAFPTWRQLKVPVITGFLLLLVGNGGMAWAEQTVPSSVAALLVATTPLWFALLGWLFYGDNRPNAKMIGGLILGLAGMVVLIGPGQLSGHAIDPAGTMVILFGAVCWAIGSLYAAHARDMAASLMSTAVQMLAGGLFLTLMAWLRGDLAAFHVEKVSQTSWLALLYLIVFGSWIGYTSYSWLIRVVPTSQASTYAYVNPLVAVLLGWLLGGESITLQMLVAGAFILPGVLLILRSKTRQAPVEVQPEEVN